MIEELEITTNNKYRSLVDFWGIPEEKRSYFDYIDNDEDKNYPRFFKYRGEFYDTHEFFPVKGIMFDALEKWHAYQSESFFSGVVIKYSSDHERVRVGMYIS